MKMIKDGFVHGGVNDSVGWNSETLRTAAEGNWIVSPHKNWSIDSFCIEEKFFGVGDVVFIKGNNSSALMVKIQSYIQKGAAGFIVEIDSDLSVDRPVLKVGSITSALESMARYHRHRLKAKTIAVTGSVGKSTTREILYHLLNIKYKVYRTLANYNLFTGVQLSIINTPIDSEFAVYEMAIGAPGSIIQSSKLVSPDAVVLTEICEVHLQRHKSLRNIVREKLRIVDGLKEGGCVAYAAETKSSNIIETELARRNIKNIISYGSTGKSDVNLLLAQQLVESQFIKFTVNSLKYSSLLNLPGKHNSSNALAALSVLPYIGVSIDGCLGGLAKVTPVKGRLEHTVIELANGKCTLIDDAFNANPTSMSAAIEYLDALKISSKNNARTILVCSDMLELGDMSKNAHEDLARVIESSKIDIIALTGLLSKFTYKAIGAKKNVIYKSTIRKLIVSLKRILKPDDIVLVKGSHSTKLYLISEALKSAFSAGLNDSIQYDDFPLDKLTRLCLNPIGGAVFIVKSNKYYSTIPIEQVIYPASLTILFGLSYIYEKISKRGEILNEEVVISNKAASVVSKWIIKEGDTVILRDLISAAAICSSNEAMVALAEWCSGSETTFALDITKYARNLGFKQSIFRNSTGLFNEGHVSSIKDIVGIVNRIKVKFPELAKIFSTLEFNFRGKSYNNTNTLLDEKRVTGFRTGRTPKSGYNLVITSSAYKDERIVVVIGCDSVKSRDSLSKKLLDTKPDEFLCNYETFIVKDVKSSSISIKKSMGEISISILGDTYFGEFYDKQRKSIGKTSYIQRYGYQHSLKKVAKYLCENDINIINLEASLTTENRSEFAGLKKWILGADPEKTIKIIKAYKIDAVLLGNNHTYDYGINNLISGIAKLSKSNVVNIGAGKNENEAIKPITLALAIGNVSRRIYLFSGYAFNKYEGVNYSCYAQGNSPGVANITSDKILKIISEVREADPSAYIIISPHWGSNYQWANRYQRTWATRYVEAGVDIVIGHGAHMLQEVEYIEGRPILYSIGNFIFNSNGEYRKRNVPPYSLLLRLKAKRINNQITISQEMTPVFCANHECNFQPHILDGMAKKLT